MVEWMINPYKKDSFFVRILYIFFILAMTMNIIETRLLDRFIWKKQIIFIEQKKHNYYDDD